MSQTRVPSGTPGAGAERRTKVVDLTDDADGIVLHDDVSPSLTRRGYDAKPHGGLSAHGALAHGGNDLFAGRSSRCACPDNVSEECRATGRTRHSGPPGSVRSSTH